MPSNDLAEHGIFNAVSSSARQLLQLLRCISFANKVHVHITTEGLRFEAEEMRVMSASMFVHKDLFSSYDYRPIATSEDGDEGSDECFQISLTSLLEVLQIFGANDTKDRWSDRETRYGGISSSMSRRNPTAAFDSRVLGMVGLCRIGHQTSGDPMCITLEEAGVTTTCELFTYEEESQTNITLRKPWSFKIIMRADWLFDAILELASASPERLTMTVSATAPHLALSTTGSLGSASVEFSKNKDLLEVFECERRFKNAYKFSLLKAATRAMGMASKVSIRGDECGVLNMQFLVGVESEGVSYVDFRFVAYIAEDGEEDGGSDAGSSIDEAD